MQQQQIETAIHVIRSMKQEGADQVTIAQALNMRSRTQPEMAHHSGAAWDAKKVSVYAIENGIRWKSKRFTSDVTVADMQKKIGHSLGTIRKILASNTFTDFESWHLIKTIVEGKK